MTHDRAQTDKLQMTQEFISHMLGVRREGVTHAAQRLQEAGFIRYVRGHIEILDRQGLEAHVCECYRVVKEEHIRLLGRGAGISRVSLGSG
jgi:Mn-dependent DtxR family transcriptional regulator